MLKKQRFTERELRLAAAEAQNYLLAQLPETDGRPYQFSLQGQTKLAAIGRQLERGELKPYPVRMGWQYYGKRSAAVILLGAALTFAVAPDVVQAACQRLIEAVETVLIEYTEFQYTSQADADTVFVPIVLQYLPAGLQEVERQQDKDSLELLYMNEAGIYFNINQCLVTEDSGLVYGVDTENAQIETVCIGAEKVTLIYKENRIHYIWLHDVYHISGQTSLSRAETIAILEQFTYMQV